MSGYDVKRSLEASLSHFWSESYGQIYPALKRLERDGLIEGRDEAQGGRPDRRVYRLTEAGLDALREWLVEPAAPVVARFELPLKLFFGAQMPPSAAIVHVESARGQAVAALEFYRGCEARLRLEQSGTPQFPYFLAVVRAGIRNTESTIAWCDETLASLRGLDPDVYPTGVE